MTKSLTLPPLQILLLRALSDWLHGCQSCTQEITETDNNHRMIKEALAEQDLIGWNYFLKGRLSKKWAIIQNDCYSRMQKESENNNLSPIPTYLDGKWWTKNLIAHTIYMCLNLWQIRNETLAALKQASKIQLLERSDAINSKFKETFACSYSTLTIYTNDHLQRWITMALLATKYNPNLAEGQRIIRAITIIPPQTRDNQTPDNRTPETPLPGDAK